MLLLALFLSPIVGTNKLMSWNQTTSLLNGNNVSAIYIYESDNSAQFIYQKPYLIKNQNDIDISFLKKNTSLPQCYYETKYKTAIAISRFSRNHFYEEMINSYLNKTKLNNIHVFYKNNTVAQLFNALPNLFFILLLVLLLRVSISKMSGGLTNSPGKLIKPKELKVDLKTVIGLNDTKEEIKQYIDYMTNRKKYVEMGVTIPRGLLFIGPPGCGKTYLAKCIASQADVSFISVTGSDFHEMFVGVGATRMKSLFATARKNSPCIIFIDEIDSLGMKRTNNVYNSEGNSVLNKLLTEMDGFGNNENIMIIAATNRPDTLDDALMRSGRFDRKLIFDKPNVNERKELYKLYLKGKKINDNLSDELILELSKHSASLTGADIKNVCNQSGIVCLREKKESIEYTHLNKAIDELLVGNEKKERLMSKEEKERVAWHEAGHCLLGCLLKYSEPPIKVSIIPRGMAALGYSMQEPSDKKLYIEDEIYSKIMVLFGGRIAENLKYGSISTGAYDDYEKATKLAKMAVTKYCFTTMLSIDLDASANQLIVGEKQKNEIYTNINKILILLYKQAEKIIEDNRVLLDSIAEKLLEKEEILKSEIEELINVEKKYVPKI